MKTIVAALALALVATSASTLKASSILLSDNFSGPSLDTSKWQTILPYGQSSVVQSNGDVTLTGRGILASVEEFAGPLTINGSFTFNNNLEGFMVHLRTDLTPLPDPDLAYALSGMFITFSNAADQVHIEGREYSPQFSTANSHGNYSFITGQTYAFSVLDTGSSIEVSINGVKEFWAETEVSTGGHIGFSDREFSFTSATIDSVTVARVPESGSMLTYLAISSLGLMALAFRRSGPCHS